MNWLLPTRRYPWTAPLLVLVAAIAIVSYTEFRRERRMKSLEQGASANDVSAALWQLLDAQRIRTRSVHLPGHATHEVGLRRRYKHGAQLVELEWRHDARNPYELPICQSVRPLIRHNDVGGHHCKMSSVGERNMAPAPALSRCNGRGE